jgi:hypothetical protein
MKTIPLSRGLVAFIDDDMYDHIVTNNWKFYFADQGETSNHRGYAKRSTDDLRLHRLVFEFHCIDIPSGMDVDHINGDRLDNRFENLQVVTRAQNLLKKDRDYVNKLGYRGVIVRKGRTGQIRYRAYVNHEGQTHWCGTFNTPEEAARAHDEHAVELQGVFANLNFPV